MWPFKSKSSKAQSNAGGLFALANDVDDNLYLSSASSAAFVDKESGAYDEFLFTEDSHREMPFEQVLDSHTDLLSARIEERGRRELLRRHRAILVCEAQITRLSALLRQLRERKEITAKDIERQTEILHGHEKGNHEVYWTDSIPHMSSTIGTRIRLITPGLTFFFAGIVDIGIIYLSFHHIPSLKGWDPIVLAIPAVGIQLVFPHLIGERIALIMRGHDKKRQNIYEALFLGIAWLSFCFALTAIRLNYMMDPSKKHTPVEIAAAADLKGPLALVSLLMLIGLGTWLMLSGSRRNPHKAELLRLFLARQKLENEISKAEIEVLAAQGQLPPLQSSLRSAEESYRQAVEVAGAELAESARMVYRRALINTMGDVAFTTSYMGVDASESVEASSSEVQDEDVRS